MRRNKIPVLLLVAGSNSDVLVLVKNKFAELPWQIESQRREMTG
jgi:hypothetical protein